VKVACVGGGPASLYFSILMKRIDPSHDITVHERNPEGATYGWGLTYSYELLHDLHAADPELAAAIAESSVSWDSWVAHIRDRTTVTAEHGDEAFGVGRHRLLGILTDRARSLGVRVEFEREIAGEDELAGADLVVAGDGVNSVLREQHSGHFGTEIAVGRNPYIWLGTTKVFDAFTFAFAKTEHGWIWCYGYKFSPTHSTCVVECSPTAWRGLGLHEANEADSLALLEKLFADILDGHPLIGRQSSDGSAHWLHFRTVTNRTWHRGNVVLLGDAAHTTHYSIGAGTALAFGDAAFLISALYADKRLDAALARYDHARRRKILLAQRAAHYSARWYEDLHRYIDLPPRQMFALLDRRQSPLLPRVPPRLYYQVDRVVEQFGAVRYFAGWLGSKIRRR
jgi:2-polyprenyl-6-methoxyphenol hydroxylase-like FAD-dependent oxidoreductase